MKTRAIPSRNKIFQYAIDWLLLAFSSVSLSQVVIQGTVKASMDQSAVPNALVNLVNLDIKGADTARVLVSSTFTNQNGEFLFQVSTNVEKDDLNVPQSFYLSNTYPNPFSDATQIDFSVQQQGAFSILIYNVLGQTVASSQNTLSPGCYSIHWHGGELPGMYFGLIRSGNQRQSFKLIQLTRKAKPSKTSFTHAALSPLQKLLEPKNMVATGNLQLFVSKTDFQMYKTPVMEFQNTTLEIHLQNGENATGILEDIDGNIYRTIKIGDQWWMAENLKVIRYRNGNMISGGGVCCYGNDETNVHTYGRLYNWLAVNDSCGLAPFGWHIPSEAEWQILFDFLGGNKVAGGKMKEAGTLHWSGPNIGAGNESGFSALPGGYRWGPHYMDLSAYATFWSSTENGSTARDIVLYFVSALVNYSSDSKTNCYSIRCIKD